jgi:uncharacterized membrane protein HdeD (DUF308 family)
MRLDVLVRNRWMIGVRGGLAIAFALALLWPRLSFGAILMLFAAYAIVDGVWSIASAVRVSARVLDAWPVALEGAVSVALGSLVLVWPFVPRNFVTTLGAWGIATGVLEVLTALALPRQGAHHWLLLTGGISSLFLAVLVLGLPLAGIETILWLLVAYAVVFGAVMLVAAAGFGRDPSAARLTAESPGARSASC